MKKYELSWKDFDREEEDRKKTAIEIAAFVFFSYFIISLVSFWQYANGEVPYSAFWHAPWIWIVNFFLK